MTKDEARALWERTQANGRALDACTDHRFEVTPEIAAKKLGRRYRCANCGGEVGAVEWHFYEQGRAHGQADGEALRAQMAAIVADCGGAPVRDDLVMDLLDSVERFATEDTPERLLQIAALAMLLRERPAQERSERG